MAVARVAVALEAVGTALASLVEAAWVAVAMAMVVKVAATSAAVG